MGVEQPIESQLAFLRFLWFVQGNGVKPQPCRFQHLWRDARASGTGASELARVPGVVPGSLAIACKRLERAGLLALACGQQDRYVVWKTLIDQGHRRVDVLYCRLREVPGAWLSVLMHCELAERLIERRRGTMNIQHPGEVNIHGCDH